LDQTTFIRSQMIYHGLSVLCEELDVRRSLLVMLMKDLSATENFLTFNCYQKRGGKLSVEMVDCRKTLLIPPTSLLFLKFLRE